LAAERILERETSGEWKMKLGESKLCENRIITRSASAYGDLFDIFSSRYEGLEVVMLRTEDYASPFQRDTLMIEPDLIFRDDFICENREDRSSDVW
jgi:hypothetical protein